MAGLLVLEHRDRCERIWHVLLKRCEGIPVGILREVEGELVVAHLSNPMSRRAETNA
jgi:hypothetical protein